MEMASLSALLKKMIYAFAQRSKQWEVTIPKYKFVVTVLILPHCLSNLLVSNKICWCRRG
jgi:hypothetical protein